MCHVLNRLADYFGYNLPGREYFPPNIKTRTLPHHPTSKPMNFWGVQTELIPRLIRASFSKAKQSKIAVQAWR